MPAQVIDGFSFKYGTNNMDPAGESIAMYYYDRCTGWGNLGVQESAFFFSGLPNGYPLPPLPPGYGWIWAIYVDIADSGYEFPLDGEFGRGFIKLNTPTMGGTGPPTGSAPNWYGNGPTGTEDCFDIYKPNGTYNGTWFSSGWDFWATWPGEIFGSEGAANMTYYGVDARGNDAGLYAAGDFTGDGTVRFMLQKNGLPLNGYLTASLSSMNQYIGGAYDIARLVGNPIPTSSLMMDIPPVGDFYALDVVVPEQYAGITVYFQGILGDLPLIQSPIDASNGIKAN